jgi:hypothetical protein
LRHRQIAGADAQRDRAGDLRLPRLERRADELHLATRPQQRRLDREWRHRHRAQQLDGDAGHLHGVPAGLQVDGAREEACGRSTVQRLRVPRAAGQLGGRQKRAVGLEEGARHRAG